MNKRQYMAPELTIVGIHGATMIATSTPTISVYNEYEDGLTPLVKENTANTVEWDGWEDDEW